ncbi:MAG: hypothetical protein JWM95_1684 [Gemmatimonadetes bacterium]|nr:hypothetical protein [Gemmatimonadota bacterium]
MDRRGFTRSLIAGAMAPVHAAYRASRSLIQAGPTSMTAQFDVRQFGAKGDGRADDSQAFIRALAAAATRGGIVVVPTGTYRSPQTLHLASGVSVRGTGASSIILHVNGEPLVFVAIDAQTIGVQDLAIAGRFAHGVLFERCSDAMISRCHISGGTVPLAGYSGAVFVAGCDGVTVQDCRFERNGAEAQLGGADFQCDGLGAASRHVRVLRNECISTDVAFNIRCHDMSRSEVRGNVVRGARLMGPPHHGYGILVYPTVADLESCVENTIADNRVSQTQGSGIYLVRSHRSRIENNIIDRVATLQADHTLPVAGIALNQCEFVSVLRNKISNSGHAGISVASDRAGVGHAEVSKNVISTTGGYGVHLRGTLIDVHVTDNVIWRAHGGIGGDTADEQDEIEIARNTITSVLRGAGIRLGNSARSNVTGNTVSDCTGYGLDVTFRDNASSASNNVVRNAGTTWGAGGDSVSITRRGIRQK